MRCQGGARAAVALALAATVVATTASCSLIGDLDGVYESQADPVDLALPAPTYALATEDGLVLRAGDQRRVLQRAVTAEWLPGGTALVYVRGGVRVWDPATNDLGTRKVLGKRDFPVAPGDLKRSVSQVDVRVEFAGSDRTDLAAYDLGLARKWQVTLPGVSDYGEGLADGMVRDYQFGHTVDAITYLPWSEYQQDGIETQPHYGLLRVGPAGEVLGEVQVNERIKSMWLAADGSALLATRRTSGDPCGGCQVELELVELDPATGDVVAEYGMPDEYDANWDVMDVDKVGAGVAIRFNEYVDPVPDSDTASTELLRGTWVLEDDEWSLLEGSEEEITWWQGPDDRVVARVQDQPVTANLDYGIFWVSGDVETRLSGRLDWPGPAYREGSIPGQLLPPEA